MRRIIVFINDPYLFYVTTIVNSEIVICPSSMLDFTQTLKNRVVGSYTNKNGESSVKLYDIFKMGSRISSVKNQFLVIRVKFYSKDSNYLSLFQGFPYGNNNNNHNQLYNNPDLIKPFLDHEFNIICNSNNELYEAILDWISYLLQNPESKNETVFIIIGEQGTGKNKFSQI
jgi:hypothetical protein